MLDTLIFLVYIQRRLMLVQMLAHLLNSIVWEPTYCNGWNTVFQNFLHTEHYL